MDRRKFVISGATCAMVAPMPSWAAAGLIDPQMIKQIHLGTNQNRARRNLHELQPNRALSKAAFGYAQTLSQASTFSHNVGGTSLPKRVDRTGYNYHRLAENIGWAERKATQVDIADWFVEAWMHSPGHRRNLLDRRLREIGIGIARRGDRYYAVQVFGTRA